MSSSNIQELFLYAWAGIFLVWFGWVLAKIFQFDNKTRHQAAISKPQLYDISRSLFKGTFLAALLLSVLLVLGETFVPFDDISFVHVLRTFLFCLIALIMFTFLTLGYQVLFLKNLLNFPFTDQKVVPIPEPPAPLPYADKSFEQLCKELDESLERLRE